MSSRDIFRQQEVIGPQPMESIPAVHRLPNEILSRIFHLAIHSIDAKDPSQLSCKYRTTVIYQYLYAFLGVCSTWRRVTLSDGGLWSIIPVFELSSGCKTFGLAEVCLERAAGRRLRLAAVLNDETCDYVSKTWDKHGARFDSISLYSNSEKLLYGCLSGLMESAISIPDSVKELSLCHSASSDGRIPRPDLPKRGYDPKLSTVPWYKRLVESLQVFRVCGTDAYFRDISFRMLTELRFQSIILGEKPDLFYLLKAIAPSSQLRKIEIISVITYRCKALPMHEFPISFPNLQHLYLEDLNFDALQLLLESIAPGPQVVTLNWTDRCSTIMIPNEYEDQDISSLNSSKIDVLMLRREHRVTFSGGCIHYILQAMPTITSLYLDSVYLDSKIVHALLPPSQSKEKLSSDYSREASAQNQDGLGFPELTKLYISRSHCHDLSALRDLSIVAANHPLEELGIGIGSDCDCNAHELYLSLDILYHESLPPPRYNRADFESEMEQVWKSLASLVPRLVRLSGNPSGMPPAVGFESRRWQF